MHLDNFFYVKIRTDKGLSISFFCGVLSNARGATGGKKCLRPLFKEKNNYQQIK
jgi:hypothetical protein